MKLKALIPFAVLACASAFAGRIWVPQNALYLRTDGLTARDGSDDFTGVIPTNDVTDPAYGTAATVAGGAGGVLSPHIDVDREPGNAPVDLTGDDFDLAFTFQFFDADGQFGFTENFDDRVQINILPVASNTDLSPRGAPGPQHRDPERIQGLEGRGDIEDHLRPGGDHRHRFGRQGPEIRRDVRS